MCAGSIPLWAHVRNKVRGDKVGLTRSSVASWGLCGVSKRGENLLCDGCLLGEVVQGVVGSVISAADSSTGLVYR